MSRTGSPTNNMSTAVALQPMEPYSQTQQPGMLRQRSIAKGDHKSSVTTTEDNAWLSSPQDSVALDLPLDSRSFQPTNTYWITPHGMLTGEIKILDLSKDLDMPFTGFSDAYKEEVKKTLKDHSFSPAFTAHRGNWLGLKYTITDSQGEQIADWKHPWSSVGEAVISFPENSPHSSHPVSFRNKTWGLRAEAFIVDSVQFLWTMDSVWHSTNMTLYKVYGSGEGQKKVKVGQYAQKHWGSFVTGGTFVVDENEIDGLVASMSLVVVLKKKRQRAAERNPGAGGGGP